MLTHEAARAFAEEWVSAWNAHDLDRVLSHYEDDFSFSSPFIVRATGDPSCKLRGKESIRRYWERGLSMLPGLRFELLSVFPGVDSLVIHYQSPLGPAAEVFHFAPSGKVRESQAHYSQPRP